jgi:hypothetical protein
LEASWHLFQAAWLPSTPIAFARFYVKLIRKFQLGLQPERKGMSIHPFTPPLQRGLALLSLLSLVLSGCTITLPDLTFLNPPTPTAGLPAGPTPTPQPSATVAFSVSLPAPLLPGETLYLSVLDEVTGLSLNPANYAMQGLDSTHFSLTVPFVLGTLVKYRYLRQGTIPIPEDDSADRPVRYRLYFVTGPGSVDDTVASWSDSLFNGPVGRLYGRITDSGNGASLPNILIAAGGQQTLTDSSGDFVMEGMTPGTHNLVAYALDGSYQTFQQGARLEADKATPANLALVQAPMISVVFVVNLPEGTIQNAPVRFAGNFYQFGNTFGDLDGGLSSVASRMPVLTPLADGRYSLSLQLPVGADLRYKYTLGDGFWNAEHAPDGSFVVRQLIVPQGPNPLQIEDTVYTWQSGSSAPITFEVGVPAETPASDTISIQFNPYAWTEPIPIWPLGNNRWVYRLYSPLNMLGSFDYRYCRNDQCGVADDVQTGPGQPGRLVATSLTSQDLLDTVGAWSWLANVPPTSLVGYPVNARPSGFWTGVEFLPGYNPTWQAWTTLAIQNLQGIYANTLVLTPSWTVSRTAPFVFAPLPGSDPLLADSLETLNRAKASNLQVAIFPSVNLATDVTSWWGSAPRDPGWWDAWFDRYQAFADYHADLAQKSGARALILGGSWTVPALPGAAAAPADSQTRWQSLLAEVRQHFTGQILWALSYPGGLANASAFLDSLDGVYLLWYAPLAGSGVDEMRLSAGFLLDSDLQPFQAALGKPLILAAAYPSAAGAAGASLPESILLQPGTTQAAVDLQAQMDIYQALLAAVNDRAWIGGFVSRGYYPPAALQDASASVHGKPAADVLWYWFSRFQGVTP